ncbi:hypothetical protein [Salinicola sp. DM10]|uniref:phage tail tip fiber protein n=1 Tax=Salinicola sp. DM10 TaxID=2815721 RepID=UPI001A8F1DC6|nr:hypothetical protein [Salinicola sp. DM10]MCE3025722.1 hypothetical protein [Salinicola sp. DM10]
MATSTRRRTLPNVDAGVDPKSRAFLQALKEIVEVGEGSRGNKLDRKLTLRDLYDTGILKFRGPGGTGSLVPGDAIPTPVVEDMATPPRPTGFAAVGSFGLIFLTWDVPQTLYGNHALTTIYRSEVDNFANAIVVGRDSGMVYSDYLRDVGDPEKGGGFYYWVTFTSTAGVEGPPNSGDGTYAELIPDTDYMLRSITGKINESVLAKTLSQRIDLIDGIGTGSVNARLQATEKTLTQADQALSQRITDAQASLGKDVAAVRQDMTADVKRIDGKLVELGARWTVQVQANGLVGGFGVFNDGRTVTAGFDADRFYVGRTNQNKVRPFIVDGDETWINHARIKQGSIQEGQLGPITIGKLTDKSGKPITTLGGLLRADSIDVDSLRINFAQVLGDMKSAKTGQNGRPAWALYRNGEMEMNSTGQGGRLEQRGDRISVYDESGTLRVRIGRL